MGPQVLNNIQGIVFDAQVYILLYLSSISDKWLVSILLNFLTYYTFNLKDTNSVVNIRNNCVKGIRIVE